jgi:hypothetical protein
VRVSSRRTRGIRGARTPHGRRRCRR